MTDDCIKPATWLAVLGVHQRAFGQAGCLDAGGATEFRVHKSHEDGGGTAFADYGAATEKADLPRPHRLC